MSPIKRKIAIITSSVIMASIVLFVIIPSYLWPDFTFMQEIVFITTLDEYVKKLENSASNSSIQKETQDKIDSLKEIIKLNNRGNFSHSLEISETYLSKNKFDGVFLNARAETLLQLGNHTDAIKDFESMNLNRKLLNSVYFLNNLAVGHILTQNYQIGHDILQDILAILENSGEKHSYQITTADGKKHFFHTIVSNNLAITLMKLEKYDEASELLRKVMFMDREYYSTYNNLAAIFFLQNNIFEANELIRIGLEYNPTSQILRNNFQITTEIIPYVLSEIQKSMIETQIKIQINLGTATSNVVKEPIQGPLPTCSKEDAVKWVDSADILIDDGLFSQALELYRKAFECDKTNTRAEVGIAYGLLETREFEESRVIFERVLEREPENLSALTGLGYLEVRVQSFNLGMSYCQQVIDINYNTYQAHNCLGEAHIKLNDYEKAIEAFQNSIHINSEKNRGYFGLGYAFLLDEQLGLAIENLKKANSQYPKDSNILVTLGRAQYENKNIEEAKETFSKIRSESGISSIFKLADCFAFDLDTCIEGNYEKTCKDAIFLYKMVEEIAQKTSEMNRASNGLGYCYRELNQPDKSILEYCKTLNRTPVDNYAMAGMCTMKNFSGFSEESMQCLEMCPS